MKTHRTSSSEGKRARTAGALGARDGARLAARKRPGSSRSRSSSARWPSATSAGASTCRPRRTRCSPRRWPCRTRASVRRPRRARQRAVCTFPTERERSQAALTKFKIAADAYPSTDAGIYARYQEGATSLALGSTPGAISAYEQVIKQSGDNFYGQMARLGLAEAQVARRSVRSGDQHLQGARAAQGRSAAGGRHPDAARTHLPRSRQARRRAADLQPAGRGISRSRRSPATRARRSRR